MTRSSQHRITNTACKSVAPAPAAGRSSAAGNRLITVLGKLDDTQKYIGRAGFNVLGYCEDWTPEMNQRFIDEAINRGDELLFVSYETSGQYRNELIQIIERLLGR